MDSDVGKKVARRERAVWVGITSMLCVGLLIVLVSPAVFAQGLQSSNDRHIEVFRQVFEFIENNYVDEVDAEELLEGALQGMFDSLDDPHSAYLTARDMRGLTDTTAGEFGGVGLNIVKQPSSNDSGGFVEVVSPIEGTPAFEAGIIAGDLIVEIEDESTRSISMDEVLNRLRGTPGTDVSVTIQRGSQHRFPVTITRAIIEVPTVRRDMIGDDIGFLRIIQFTPHTDDRVKEAIEYFSANGYSSMVIDLRSNPGGMLTGVVDTANLFFSGGTIVGTRGRIPSENKVFSARRGQEVPDELPIIVLIDGGSASAAEILAGALKDRERALVIGETTFGKGSVQQVRRIGAGGFRLTMSRYYTPSGVYIDKEGIVPDIELALPKLEEDEIEAFTRLRTDGLVREFVAEDADRSRAEIDAFIQQLQDDGYNVPDFYLRRMIRDAVNRAKGVTTVYDLEFDPVLQEAVRILRAGEYGSELRAAAAAAAAASGSSN